MSKYLVTILNIPAHKAEQQTNQHHTIEAETHEQAISEAMELCDLEGQLEDTLAAYATPLPQDEAEDQLQQFIEESRKPITREYCEEKAREAPDQDQRDWWLEEAQTHRPKAEGGGAIEPDHEQMRQRREARLRQAFEKGKASA